MRARGILAVVLGQERQQLAQAGQAGRARRGSARWATPERLAWVCAPPSSSLVTSSWVTALMTSGPVMNMWLVDSTMKMKSVMAGE